VYSNENVKARERKKRKEEERGSEGQAIYP
jgi:hypothetical protein